MCTENIFVHHLHLPKIGDTFLNGVSLSDLIWTYVVTGAYCLVQGRVWRFYQRNKNRLNPLSGIINLSTPPEENNSLTFIICAVLWKSAATAPFQDYHPYTVYHKPSTLLTRSYPLLYPCRFTPQPCRCDAFQHLATHLDAFRQFWHILRYIYFEQDGTDLNICNRNGVKNGYFRFVRPYQ